MKFFKENSYDIVKLFINQIGIAIFSMMLYVSVGLLEDAELKETLKILVSVFSILFYYALVYTAAWDFGAKDKIKFDSGKIKLSTLKGVILGLFANSLNFIVTGIALICKLIHFGGGGEAFNVIFAILNAVFRFFMSMYLGVINAIFPINADIDLSYILQTLGFLAFPILVIGVTALGYYLGTREWRFGNLFSDKKSK